MISQLQKKQVTGGNPVQWDLQPTVDATLLAVFRHNSAGMTTPYQPLSSAGYLPLVQALGADNYIGIFGKTAQAGEALTIPTNSVSGTLGVELMEYKSDQGILSANFSESDVPAGPGSTLTLGPAPSRAAKGKERLLLAASSTNGGHNQVNTPPWSNGFVEQQAMNVSAGQMRGSVAHLVSSWSTASDAPRSTSYTISQTGFLIVGAMLELFVPELVTGPGGETEGVGLKYDAVSGSWKDISAFVAHVIPGDPFEWR